MGEQGDDPISRKIKASEAKLQDLLAQVQTLTMLVEADPGSCLHYTVAFNTFDFISGQSEPAGDAAARAHERIRAAHTTAVPEDQHDPRCALYGGSDPKGDWLHLGYDR